MNLAVLKTSSNKYITKVMKIDDICTINQAIKVNVCGQKTTHQTSKHYGFLPLIHIQISFLYSSHLTTIKNKSPEVLMRVLFVHHIAIDVPYCF